MVVYGLVLVVAAWLAGHTRPATAVRIALAPSLRTRPAAVYVAVYFALLLVIVWGPTPATRQLPYIVAFIVLLALGVHALRRQTAREFPDAQSGDTMRSIRALYGRAKTIRRAARHGRGQRRTDLRARASRAATRPAGRCPMRSSQPKRPC